jgi:dolichyl-phosphate beta-glucosyltransferase
MRRFIEFIISLAVAGLALYALFRHFDLRETMWAVRQVHVRLLVVGFALMVGAYVLRGARWRIWERSLSYWNSLRFILIGFMGNNVLPARLGEILRAHCAAQRAGADRGRTALLASIAAERVLDGLVLGVFGLVAINVVPVDRRLRYALLLVSLIFAGLTSVLVFTIRHHERIRSAASASHRRLPGRLTAFAQSKTTQLLDGLLPLGTLSRMLAAISTTAIIWGLEVGTCYFIGLAVWSRMSPRAALLFLVVVNFAALVPVTMGGIGAVETAGPLFLISTGVSRNIALAMVLLQHAVQYLFTTTTGGVLYLGGRLPHASPARASTTGARNTVPPESSVTGVGRPGLSGLSLSEKLPYAPSAEIQLSIVIPAHNEQTRLPRTVQETVCWCKNQNLAFEVIIVDDGSQDETLALARLLEQRYTPIRVLACPHTGKGGAVRAGMLNSRGLFSLFLDADGATPLDEIPKLLAAVANGHDVAIGSRVVRRAGEVQVRTSYHRRLVSRAFALLVSRLAFKGIADTQCGFKMFRRKAAGAIFSRQRTTGFAFDVEILFIAQRLQLSIAEIPVNWSAQPGSKVSFLADPIRMLWDIGRIRWLHRHLGRATLAIPEKVLGDSAPDVYVAN